MQSFYDYKKFIVLYVDDEEKSLKYFARAFGGTFRILTAPNAEEGMQLLAANKDEVGILVTDQRMPGEKGTQLLERARQLRPRILRMLATAYSDLDAAIDAVNSGAIYKYVTKPWDVPDLETTLKRAMEFFIVQRERDQLLHEKLSVLHNMMISDRVISLGVLAGGLGHHVRNALVAVRTFLDLAPGKLEEERVGFEDLKNPQFWRDFYEHVQRQVNRITEMLSVLGGVAMHPEARFDTEVDIEAVLRAAIDENEDLRAKKRIEVTTDLEEGLPRLKVDGGKFKPLFQLLILDEMEWLPEGSRLQIQGKRGRGEVEIIMEDNGPGLPENALRSVFDPFFVRREEPQEYGIRLMTCYFIVYHHGGRIEVESGSGTGTRFRVFLPENPAPDAGREGGREFVSKVLMNDAIWEKLLSGV